MHALWNKVDFWSRTREEAWIPMPPKLPIHTKNNDAEPHKLTSLGFPTLFILNVLQQRCNNNQHEPADHKASCHILEAWFGEAWRCLSWAKFDLAHSNTCHRIQPHFATPPLGRSWRVPYAGMQQQSSKSNATTLEKHTQVTATQQKFTQWSQRKSLSHLVRDQTHALNICNTILWCSSISNQPTQKNPLHHHLTRQPHQAV